MAHDLKLISFDICPYVERSRIVLEEKDVDYEVEFISLEDKPDWFLEISPRGKVPVLVVDDEPIFESTVINELLEELYPDPPLFPDDPFDRARARSWIALNDNDIMGPTATLWFSDDEADIRQAREDLREAFATVDEQLAEHDGDYFLGDNFGLVDAVYAPVFNRWEAAERLGHGDLMDDFDQLRSYGERLVERDSSKAARDPELTEKLLD